MPFKMISQCCTAHPILCMTSRIRRESARTFWEYGIFFNKRTRLTGAIVVWYKGTGSIVLIT